jgi:hypothetical protein
MYTRMPVGMCARMRARRDPRHIRYGHTWTSMHDPDRSRMHARTRSQINGVERSSSTSGAFAYTYSHFGQRMGGII